MVDLPKVSTDIVTSTAPKSAITPGVIEQTANDRANAYGKVADDLMDVSTDLAKKDAANQLINQKITRNADGSVNVENPVSAPLIFGDAGKAFSDAVKVGTIAQQGNSLSQDFAKLHTKFPTDPAGFKAAADAHLAQTAQTVTGPMGEAVQREGQQLLTQHYNAITSTSASNDIENQKKSITSQIEDQKNTAIALARQNGADSPEFKQAVTKMNLSYDALASNPLFKMPQDQIDLEKKNTSALLQGEAVVAHVDEAFNKRGKPEAQKALEESILQNPNLREVDRSRLYTQGMSRLAYLTADAKVNIDANRQITTHFEDGLAKGTVKAEDPAVGMAVQRARDIGDIEGAQRITAAAAVQQHLRGVNSLPDALKADVLATGSAVDLGKIQGAILGQESGNRSNIGNSVDGARGPGQIMPATFAQYAKPGERIDNPDDNRAVNGRILADYSQRYNGDPARIAVAYFSGPGNVAPAGSPTPYLRDAKDGNGKATSGYVSDVLKRLGPDAGAPAANGGPPFNYQQVMQNPYLLSAYAKTLAADPELRVQAAKQTAAASIKSLDNGIMPPMAGYAEVMQAAKLYPEKMGGVADDLQGRLVEAQKILQVPEEQRSALIESYKRAADGSDVHHLNIANAMLDQVSKQGKNLQEHPYQEAVSRGWTQPATPLDPAQPEGIAPALAQRAALGDRIGGLNHTPAPPLLDKDEVPKLQSALQGPNGAQVLSQIGQALRPDEMQRLIEGDGFKESVTAMSRSGDPVKMNAAYSFMDSQQRQNPLQFDRQFPDGLKDLRAWQSNLAFYPPDEAAKRLMRQYDPAQSAAMKAADEVAHKALESVSADKVVDKFSTGFGPIGTGARSPVTAEAGIAAGALKADYDKNYKDGYAATGDPTAADKFAMEKLKNKYAVSETNGNRVTAFAPERYYPEVGGSHDWMAKQLDDMVAASTGADRPPARLYGTVEGIVEPEAMSLSTEGQRQYTAPRAIVPDASTEADIAAGKPPSYRVVIQDSNGRWDMMTAPKVGTDNLQAATKDMSLTPQEQALYQRHLTNLTGSGGVDNPDGSRSTLFQTTVEHDGKFYAVPTVWNGKILIDKDANGKFDGISKEGLDNVKRAGWDTFPSYKTEDEAEARYQQMHTYMDKDTGTYFASKSGLPQRVRFDPTDAYAKRAATAETKRAAVAFNPDLSAQP